jgi:hypothetical protein
MLLALHITLVKTAGKLCQKFVQHTAVRNMQKEQCLSYPHAIQSYSAENDKTSHYCRLN